MPRRQAAFGGGSMTYKESSFPWSRLWLIENDREDGMRCSEDQARAYRGRVTHAAGHSRRKAQLGIGGSKTDAPLLAIQMRSKGDAERVSKNQSRIVRPPCVGFSLAPPSLKHAMHTYSNSKTVIQHALPSTQYNFGDKSVHELSPNTPHSEENTIQIGKVFPCHATCPSSPCTRHRISSEPYLHMISLEVPLSKARQYETKFNSIQTILIPAPDEFVAPTSQNGIRRAPQLEKAR